MKKEKKINEELLISTETPFVEKHKNNIIYIFLGLTVLLVGLSFFKSSIDNKTDNAKQQVYLFEQETLKNFTESKIKQDQLISKFNTLENSLKNSTDLFPLIMSVAYELRAKGYGTQALAIYEKGLELSLDKYSRHFLLSSLAVAYEEEKKYELAKTQLQKLLDSKNILKNSNTWLSKVWLDKGRLNLEQGNYKKARTDFNYLIENFPNEKHAKYAEIYLYELKNK
jgi:tetratricopeptide (TPR) repeat protein